MEKQDLDLLKKVEELTAKLNDSFGKRSKSVFARYPLLFALLIIFGGTMMSQGVKEIIYQIDIFKYNPWLMFGAGILILVLTGTLYKKLEK